MLFLSLLFLTASVSAYTHLYCTTGLVGLRECNLTGVIEVSAGVSGLRSALVSSIVTTWEFREDGKTCTPCLPFGSGSRLPRAPSESSNPISSSEPTTTSETTTTTWENPSGLIVPDDCGRAYVCYATSSVPYYQPCVAKSDCTCSCFYMYYTALKYCGSLGLCEPETFQLALDPTPLPELVPGTGQEAECTHDEDGIYCTYSSFTSPYLMVTRGSWSIMVYGNETYATVYYPTLAKGLSAEVYITLLDGSTAVLTDSWWEPGQRYCDLIGGWICCNRNHLTCATFYSPYWWVFLVVLLAILLLCFVPCFYVMVAAICKACIYVTLLIFKAPVAVYRKLPARKKGASFVVVLLLPIALACDTTTTITSTNACTLYTEGGVQKEDCWTSFDLDVNFPFIGSEACVRLNDDSGSPIAELRIKYKNATALMQTDTLYYTGAWWAQSESTKHCWGVGACEDDYCAEMEPTDYDASGELKDELILSWPGLTTCAASCGCAGCGCFYCRDGCLFSRIGVVPNNTEVFKVLSPSLITLQPFVSLELDALTNPTNGSGAITDDGLVVGDFNLVVNGLFQGSTTSFGSNNFICSPSSGCYFGFASPRNAPIAGSVGDLQAPTSSYPTNPSRTAFSFPFTSFTKNVQQNKATYVAPVVGATRLSSYPTLPMLIGDVFWDYVGGSFVGLAKSTGGLSVKVTTLQDLLFTSVVAAICPEVEFYNATGCYSCLTPVVAWVKARSTCGAGLVSVSVPSPYTSLTTAVELTSAWEFIDIEFLTPIQDVDTVITIGSAQVPVEFTAVENIDVNIDTISNVTDVPSTPDEDTAHLNFFAKWFPSLPSWLAILLDIVLLIACIVVLCLLIWLAYKLFKRMCRSKVKVY